VKCRHCNAPLSNNFLDLGFSPPSNAYLTGADLSSPEKYYPLRVLICGNCWLVQTEDYAHAHELFHNEYAYFSGTSDTWLAHARKYAQSIREKLRLGSSSLTIEIASNDGYLLKNFLDSGLTCLGIEPTASTACIAESIGIPVIREFFCESLGEKLASQGKRADLIIGNNVYAHVPDINDFTRGLKVLLKQDGTITLEFPHLLNLIANLQFDTIYHEHFSYLSLDFVCRIFETFGLRVYDVEELTTHGGSLRVYGCHLADARRTSRGVYEVLGKEKIMLLNDFKTYTAFKEKVAVVKNNFLEFLISKKRDKKKVAAYGAAAKGNTILNYAGVKADLLPFVYDKSLSKQGRFLPGSHLPIVPPVRIELDKPDFLIIFPWNIKDEVMSECEVIRKWGGQFVTVVPDLLVS